MYLLERRRSIVRIGYGTRYKRKRRPGVLVRILNFAIGGQPGATGLAHGSLAVAEEACFCFDRNDLEGQNNTQLNAADRRTPGG